jgi:hypothetical protein
MGLCIQANAFGLLLEKIKEENKALYDVVVGNVMSSPYNQNKKILDSINSNIVLLTTTNDDDYNYSCNAGLYYHTRVFKDEMENSRVFERYLSTMYNV